jgi:hypothetical protein
VAACAVDAINVRAKELVATEIIGPVFETTRKVQGGKEEISTEERSSTVQRLYKYFTGQGQMNSHAPAC